MRTPVKLSDFSYDLPRQSIAQRPLERRDSSRLLLLERGPQRWEDSHFSDLPDLLRGDELVVINNTRVLCARLIGHRVGVKAEAPGRQRRAHREFLRSPIEVLLTRRLEEDFWEALVKPGRKMRTGERVVFGQGELEAEVVGRGEYGLRLVRLRAAGNVLDTIERLGHVPLPPYIDRPDEAADRERYQTVFARETGAVAAPTAGLHFTPEILARIEGRGIEICEITLHVGLGTFQPIHVETIEQHRMHREAYEISEQTAARISAARRDGRPILAVGTTVVRALEDAAQRQSMEEVEHGCTRKEQFLVRSGCADAELFIYPGYRFQVVDQLLTNFHLPRSTLLVMVAAFAGREFILRAYEHAVGEHYRFYSYGDCMLIR